MTDHQKFIQSAQGATHNTRTELWARRCIDATMDEAQLEIKIGQSRIGGNRTMALHSSLILAPADAVRLALAIAPELTPTERTGRELYTLWSRKISERGCTTDTWEDIEQLDREAWLLLAVELL